ncbi:MAG: family 43 glycosylhydrolase, partial [Victivallales bacterium]|nr:family 43 glycosylhydrolase [Victivallales bacterium]
MLNYWKPDNGFFVGDCMPFYHDGTYHLYYLLDQGHHNHPIVGKAGGHQWAHASSQNLIDWKQHPLALPLDFASGETSICTGSVIEKDGKFYAFYALRASFFNEEHLRFAVSSDNGITFQKLPPGDWELPGTGFGPAFRDPEVFLDDDGVYHLLVSSRCRDGANKNGVLLHARGTDLFHWSRYEPLLYAQAVPECPNLFRWGKFYYLFFGQNGITHYRLSSDIKGPWLVPGNDIVGCPSCRVMKSAPWENGRRIAAGWMPTYENGTSRFGGRTIFRELRQSPDGGILVGLVPEFLADRPENALPDIALNCSKGYSVQNIGDFGGNFELKFNVSFSGTVQTFGLLFSDPDGKVYRHIDFSPTQKTIRIDCLTEIYQVDLKSAGNRIHIVKNDGVTDVEINGERAVVFSMEGDLSGIVSCFSDSGNVNFEQIR